jgi:hypothetical protein
VWLPQSQPDCEAATKQDIWLQAACLMHVIAALEAWQLVSRTPEGTHGM